MPMNITATAIESTRKTVRRFGSLDERSAIRRVRCALLRHDCKVASTPLRIAPEGVEDRIVAARAESRIDETIVSDSSRAEQRRGERRKVEMRLRAARTIDVTIGVGERELELLDDFFADFETTDANRRTEVGVGSRGVEARLVPERVDGQRGDLLHGAAPAGMNVGDDAVRWIDERDRQTVGDLDSERGLSLGAPERVA